MASPIASPQNIVAMEVLEPLFDVDWAKWLVVSMPVTIVCNVLIWLFLFLTFNFKKDFIRPPKKINKKFGPIEYFILLVVLLTIGLWCFADQVKFVFGGAAIIGLIPFVFVFHATGILNSFDLQSYSYDIICVTVGASIFGKTISSCGLLGDLTTFIDRCVSGLPLFWINLICSFFMLVMGTFISHTVSAIVLIPLALQLGTKLQDEYPIGPEILIFSMALMASCEMALPTSVFPNFSAVSQVGKKNRPYLNNNLFIKFGGPSGFVGFVIVVTFGFGVMTVLFRD